MASVPARQTLRSDMLWRSPREKSVQLRRALLVKAVVIVGGALCVVEARLEIREVRSSSSGKAPEN
jgi:hypothetical protein